jgi:hypothetical protein
MKEGDELDRLIARLNKTLDARQHAIRRLRVGITHLEDAGKLKSLQPWIVAELCRIENNHHNVTEAIDRLAGDIDRHLTGAPR